MKIKKIIKVYCMILVAVLLLGSCGPKNGFVKEGEYTYYYNNGEKQYGWQEINGDWYYFVEHTDEKFVQGAMLTSIRIQDNGSFYGLGSDGKMVKNRFKTYDNRIVYFGSDGKQLFNTEITVEGQKYTIDSNGTVKEAPYYSAPAPMGGTYNFYLKQPLPLSISSGRLEWVIESPLIFEQFRFGNYISISGIIELHGTDNTTYTRIVCRLSTKSENGLTSAEEKGLHHDNIAGGEKTRFEVSFDNLPLAGCDIYVDFSY